MRRSDHTQTLLNNLSRFLFNPIDLNDDGSTKKQIRATVMRLLTSDLRDALAVLR